MVRHLIVLLCFQLITFGVNAAQIDVGVDRNPVNLDESFVLLFRSNETADDDPDFAPLNQDFEILSQQKKQQMSWVNGNSSRVSTWVLKMIAKRAGKLQIPKIYFGDDESTPLTITVKEAADTTPVNGNTAFFLQAEVNPEKHYVQSQILYTIRFFRNVKLAQAGLNELKIENAVVEKLGEERGYNKRLNGVEYAVSELRYAIFPQKSGRLKIPSLALTAQVMMDSPQSRYNNYFNRLTTQTRRIYSNAIELDVLPVPAGMTSKNWLPTKALTLQQTWSNDDLQAKVGEPITRTITLKAEGLMVSQLPELDLGSEVSLLKIYPDKPLLNNEITDAGITAVFQQKIAYIPSESGRFKLPAITFPWFNRQTGKMEIAKLGAVSLSVSGGGVGPVIREKVEQKEPIKRQEKELQQPLETGVKSEGVKEWKWLSLLLAVGWAATLLFIFLKRNREESKPEAAYEKVNVSGKEALKKVQLACIKNDPAAARKALIEWALLNYGSANLDSISSFDADLKREIDLLNQVLYGTEDQKWQGKRLSELLEKIVGTPQKQKADEQMLEPLYKGE